MTKLDSARDSRQGRPPCVPVPPFSTTLSNGTNISNGGSLSRQGSSFAFSFDPETVLVESYISTHSIATATSAMSDIELKGRSSRESSRSSDYERSSFIAENPHHERVSNSNARGYDKEEYKSTTNLHLQPQGASRESTSRDGSEIDPLEAAEKEEKQ